MKFSIILSCALLLMSFSPIVIDTADQPLLSSNSGMLTIADEACYTATVKCEENSRIKHSTNKVCVETNGPGQDHYTIARGKAAALALELGNMACGTVIQERPSFSLER